eukprot:54937-Eustigmatos_ZCMA.PRE.2
MSGVAQQASRKIRHLSQGSVCSMRCVGLRLSLAWNPVVSARSRVRNKGSGVDHMIAHVSDGLAHGLRHMSSHTRKPRMTACVSTVDPRTSYVPQERSLEVCLTPLGWRHSPASVSIKKLFGLLFCEKSMLTGRMSVTTERAAIRTKAWD